MSWRAPVVSAALTVDPFYEPFLDSSGNVIIIRPKPREVVHFVFVVDTAGATDTLGWQVLGGERLVNNALNGLDGIVADLTWTTTTNANDDITFASPHKLFQTGDGPFRLTTGGTLPSGLSAGTDYWIIVNDSTDIAFASSLINALAGTVVALANDGSGTHTLVLGGKGTSGIALNTTADTQADDYYNEMFIHFTSGLSSQELRAIADYVSSGDVATLLHSSNAVLAAADKYDIYAMAQIVDGSGTITTVASTGILEASPQAAEFGASGYPVLIPRARASGGTDAHNVKLIYTIDGVDA